MKNNFETRIELEIRRRALENELKFVEKEISSMEDTLLDELISDGHKGKISLFGWTLYIERSSTISGPKDEFGKLDRQKAIEAIKDYGWDYLITYDHLQIRSALNEFKDDSGEYELPPELEAIFTIKPIQRVKMRTV